MSNLAREDDGGAYIQAFDLPISGKTSILPVSTSSSYTPLPNGMYRFLSDVTVYMSSSTTSTISDLPLLPNIPEYFQIDDGLSVIVSSGTGTLTISLC